MSSALGVSPTFIISSKTRQSGDINNFIHKIDFERGHEFDSIALISASIPKSYYMLDSTRDNITLGYSEDGDTSSVILSSGDYNATNLIYLLSQLLTAGSPNGYTYTVTFADPDVSPVTNKLIFQVTGNAGIQPIFTFYGTTYNELAQLTGFEYNTSYQFVGDILISPNIVNYNLIPHLIIKSDIARNSGDNTQDTAILGFIPTHNVTVGGTIDYQMLQIDHDHKDFINHSNNSFNFALYDDDDRLLNLNGLDWFCQIMLYKKDRSSQYLINDLKIKYMNDVDKKHILDDIDIGH